MRFFDFLKSKKAKEKETIENTVQTSEQKCSMPTIKPQKELFEYYDEVFNSMIDDITGLTASETEEILCIIKKCEGGFLNMAGYYSVVWEKYFQGKKWFWNEYEEWNNAFKNLGKFPSRFPRKFDLVTGSIEYLLNELTVSELKAICIKSQIGFIEKTKKRELIDILKTITDIGKLPVIVKKSEEINSRFEYEIYSLFLRTISFRAKNLYDIRRARKLGIDKFEVVHIFKEDKEFVDLALKKNPKALHPVFPSDMSIKQPVIDL